MNKAILIPVLVGTCAWYARAADVHPEAADRLVESVQDFEFYDFDNPEKSLNIHRKSEITSSGSWSGDYYWNAPEDSTLVTTKVKLNEETGGQYLEVNASERPDEGLMRAFTKRSSFDATVTNAYTRVAGEDGYDGFYCSFKTKFPLYDAGLGPTRDGGDRLIVWARKDPADETKPGFLYITAGSFVGDVRRVEPYDYLITTTNIDADAWHDVVIRSVPDIRRGARSLGFLVWIDGMAAVAGGDYPVFADCDVSEFTDEAKVLAAQRRLFPALTLPGVNRSIVLGGVAFTGVSAIDDIAVSASAPGSWAESPRVFKLIWDAGVVSVKYRIGEGDEVEVPSGDIHKRSVVIEIPRAETGIEVAATYDTAGDYSQGFWGADGACSLVTNVVGSVTNYAFVCNASADPGTGYVRSFRREIGLGGGIGSFATFADAKEQAILQGVTLVLNGDFAASLDSRDLGEIVIGRGETLTIDLNGHTISNAVGEYPTIENYGKLTIIDSVGGGKVLPYSDYFGDELLFRREAVHNFASPRCIPELTIRGGIYDGVVNNGGEVTNSANSAHMEGVLSIVRNAFSPGDPQFISVGGDEFEFNDKLEDLTLYYSYEEPYWIPLTNAFVWCGKGADDKWSNPENWRCNAVPGDGDYAIFPASGTNVWEADMETGIEVRDIWFAGDVVLHGSADFTDVKWKVPADGRVSGDAVLVWNGRLPPDLTTLLDGDWAGTVAINDVGNSSPKLMTDMATWGTGSSTVRFRGVRGYYHMTSNITLPYTLELQNGSNGYGWKNDAGFTGGVIEFPRLVGSGNFVSPKNTIANQQIIIFRDVYTYTGVMDVKGKRVVLGPGNAATLEVGSITWSDGLRIKIGQIHTCRVAAFEGTIDVYGSYGDQLAEYTGSTVGDTAEVVNLMPGSITAEICVTNPVGTVKVARWSEDAILVDGRRVVTNVLEDVNSLTSISSPSASALKKLTFAKYYTPSVVEDGGVASVKLSLNEFAVPVIGAAGGESAKITFVDGMASIVVSDVIEGFWYGLEYKSRLEDEWPAEPYIWTVANPFAGGLVELIAPAEGPSGFYRVVVSDVKPEERRGR